MKKIKKTIISVILTAILLSLGALNVFADTVYVYNGYSFTMLDNQYISICGWNNSSENFVVPAQLDGSYVKEIADLGLRGNEAITSVDFSSAIYMTRIGNLAFKGCSNVAGTVSVPARITDVGISAFQECSSIESFNYYAVCDTVPIQCCYMCSSLKNVVLSDNVTAVEKLAFANCDALESVRIPRSVTSINVSAFSNSSNAVLSVFYGTYAHQYAMDNNIAYVLLDGVKLGDADGDGVVTINDVTAIQQHVADMKYLEGIYLYAADVNRDGVTNISDATDLQRFLAEYEAEYPIDSVITQ